MQPTARVVSFPVVPADMARGQLGLEAHDDPGRKRDLHAESIVARSPLATLILGPDMRVEYLNRAAEKLFGWALDELVGQPHDEMIPPDRREEARALELRMRAGETLQGVETRRLGRDGTEIDVAIYGAPFGGERDGAFAIHLVDLRERNGLLEIAHQDAERQRLLSDFLSSAAAATDERGVLDGLVQRAADAGRAACLVYRANADNTELDVVAIAGYRPDEEERLRAMFADRRWRADEGIAGRAFAQDAMIANLYLTEEERAAYLAGLPEDRRDAMAALDLRAMIAVPIRVERRAIGVLGLERFGSNASPFEPRDAAFAEQLAGGASVVLARLAAAAEREREAREAQLLAEFGQAATEAGDEQAVLGQLAQRASVAVDGSLAVYRISADGRELQALALTSHDGVADAFRQMYAVQPWRADEGLMGLALETHDVVFRPYLSAAERSAYLASLPDDRRAAMRERDLRAIIAIPLTAGSEQIGILTFARYGPDARPLTDRDRAFAEALATRASIALTRLALERERQQEADRKSLLAEFLAAAASARNEQEVLDAAAQRTCEALGGTCSIYRLTKDGRELEVVALSGDDPARDDALRSMFAAQAWRADEGTMGRALATGETIVRSMSTEEARGAYLASLPEDRRAAMAAIDLRAIVTVPLIADGERRGVLALARYGPATRPFTELDRTFAEELAARTSIALSRLAADADREREARQTRVLAEFLEGVSEANGDENGILQRLSAAAATEMGDVCLIKFLTPDGAFVELRAVAARDEQLAGVLRALFAAHSLPSDRGIDRDVLATGQPRLAQLDPDELRQRAYPGFEAIVAHDFTSLLVAPLRIRGAVAGDIMMLREAPSAPYDTHDLAFLEELARRASLILERHRAERARDEAAGELRRTSATLRTMFDASPLATQLLDAEGRVVMWSPAAERLFGFSAEEAIGHRPPTIPQEELPDALDMANRVARGEVVNGLPARRVRKDGTSIEVLLYGAPIRDESGGTRLLGIYADMTERNRLESELRRTSDTLRAILDGSPLPILAVDNDRRVTFWNRAAERLYGWTSQEVVGRRPPGQPDEPGTLESSFERLAAGELVEGETRRRTKDGRTLEIRIRSAPLRDEAGSIRGALAIHEDVTEHKRLEAELLQAQKMETVGRLAGGVAHDFNNILTAIIGYADLARAIAAEPDVQSALTTIRTAGERAAGLTQQLLAFSRRQMLQPQVIEANEVVLGMESILRRLIGEDIELSSAVTANAGSILVDRTQLEQVILNLAVNARDAMPEGGRLVLRTERATFRGDHTHVEMAPGDYVVISVTDTGMGMDAETKAHIFEPFFTTKDVGKGTGLGLATTYGIVRQSGGYIWVYSEPGHGSTFKLYFPAVGARAATAPAPERRVGGTRGRILVVEDEPTLRELARRILTRDGFGVVQAKDPATALTIAADASETFDLLLTDVVMPGMSGIELARRLRQGRPDLRVLLMSGYAEGAIEGTGSVARRFLAKPFTPDGLLRAVDDSLAETSPRSEA